jgi:hypothetical protein
MPKFVAYWGEGYGISTAEIHPLAWFSEDCGYTPANIWHLSNLKIGESADLTDLSGVHYVMRVE